MGGNKLVVLSVVLVLAFIGCTLPPSPSSPGLSGEDSGLIGFAFRHLSYGSQGLEDFSPPIDVFDNDRVIFNVLDEISPRDGETTVEQEFDYFQPGGYLWGDIYYLDYEDFKWRPYSLGESRVGNSNWIADGSFEYLRLPLSSLQEGENYIIAYSCKKYDDEWKCGCLTQNGPCNQWMLQEYDLDLTKLPPGPVDPPGIEPERDEVELGFDVDGREFNHGDKIELIGPYYSEAFGKGKLEAEYVFNSYIVEMETPPLLARHAEIGADYTTGLVGNAINIAGLISQSSKERLKADFERERKLMIDEQQEVLDALLNRGFVGNSIAASTVRVKESYTKVFNGMAMNMPEDRVAYVESLPGVKRVSQERKLEAFLDIALPAVDIAKLHSLDENGADCEESGKECITGEGVTVAVIDTGVDYTHPSLGGCLGTSCKVIGGHDFVNDDSNPMDDHGHGTHVASTVAGDNDVIGAAPGASILAYKALDAGGGGSEANIIAAVERAVDPNGDLDFSDHADIISMSLGGFGHPDDPLSTSIDVASEAGVLSVIAAGNSGPFPGSIMSPAGARSALTVGASCTPDQVGSHFLCNTEIADFSSRGPTELLTIKPDVLAPGVEICAAEAGVETGQTECGSQKITISGTSMATPIVAGLSALVMQVHPDWTAQEVKMAIRNNANGLSFDDFGKGYGIVDGDSVFGSTPPVAILGEVGFIDSDQPIEAKISAHSDDYLETRFYIGEGEFPDQYELIITDSTEFFDGTVAINNQYDEGIYQLLIEVEDTHGVISRDKVYFVVEEDDEPPRPPPNTGHLLGSYVHNPTNQPITGDLEFEIRKIQLGDSFEFLPSPDNGDIDLGRDTIDPGEVVDLARIWNDEIELFTPIEAGTYLVGVGFYYPNGNGYGTGTTVDVLCETDQQCGPFQGCVQNECELLTCTEQGGQVCPGESTCADPTTPADGTDSCCLAGCDGLDLCENVICEFNEACSEGICELITCDAMKGTICEPNESCNVNTVEGSDTDSCCLGFCQQVKEQCTNIQCPTNKECVNGLCELKSCNEQGGLVCNDNARCNTDTTDASDGACCTGTCVLKTCNDLGGNVCQTGQTCSTTPIDSVDSGACCTGTCGTPTCESQGGVICEDGETCGDPLSSTNSGVCCGEPCSEGVVEIDITAQQFSFSPGTITVPKGTRIKLNINSIDVTHGFTIPDFGVSVVLSPGVEVSTEFVADKVGTFSYSCSVFCGGGHSNMKGTLIVTS